MGAAQHNDVAIRFRTIASSPIDITNYYMPIALNQPAEPPEAPANLKTIALSSSAIQLTWDDNAMDEDSYSIERSPNGSSWGEVATLPADTTSWQNSSLSPNTPYYYRVRAHSSAGYSNYSNVAKATTLPAGPLICNPDFEQGRTCWSEASTHSWEIIVNAGFPETIIPLSGSWIASLGGELNDISSIQQRVIVPGISPYLAYYHWIVSADACGHDFGKVLINDTVVNVYDLCSDTSTGEWVMHVVDLSAYSGQSVLLQVRAETNSSVNSNLFIDDFSFVVVSRTAENETGVPAPVQVEPVVSCGKVESLAGICP